MGLSNYFKKADDKRYDQLQVVRVSNLIMDLRGQTDSYSGDPRVLGRKECYAGRDLSAAIP